MQELLCQIALLQVPGVGDITAKQLVSHFGNAKDIFALKKEELLKTIGVGSGIAQAIIAHKKDCLLRAEEELTFITNNNINTTWYGDKHYPKKLKACNDSPFLLYYKGNIEQLSKYNLAIVGTRKATNYGIQITEKIVDELQEFDVTITSGLAYGIDICAHKQALKNKLTTHAVVAHGLDSIYPSAHSNYAKEILQSNGCLITEHISKTPPDRENFPKRNRIVAGMCDAILVIEAGEKGGALITAEIAHSYNREIMAVPGRTSDLQSVGCNNLIMYNKAGLVTNAKDIARFMNWQKRSESTKLKQATLFAFTNEDEEQVFKTISENTNLHVDEISFKTKIPPSKLAGILLNLEFSNYIKSLPGKRYICK